VGALETFGAGRMLFGTDSPPLTTPLRQALDLVAALPTTPGQRADITEHNARRLFGLETAPGGADREH